MKKLRKIFLVFALVTSAVASEYKSHEKHLCKGFLPKNNLKVPIHKNKSLSIVGGLSQETTQKVIDVVAKIYAPIIQERHDSKLNIINNWTNNGVNAFASRVGSNTYQVEI